MERVSVVIPTYNRAHLLKETLGSVLSQTVPVHEIIVVDDGSTDSTHEIVRSYGRSVILIIQNHAGAAAARNRGIANATGGWIALLDSDDLWKPTKIAKQLQYLDEHPPCCFVHTGYYHFGTEDRVIPPSPHFLRGDYKVDYLLFAEDFICPSSVIFRKDIQVVFREWVEGCEDIIFFADMLRSGVQFAYIKEPLAGYRVHSVSVNTEAKAQYKGASSQWRWINETFDAGTEERQRLRGNILRKAIGRMQTAKWGRNWQTYWEWREWITENWPEDIPQSKVVNERIFPPIAYKFKDILCLVANRVRKTTLCCLTEKT